MAYVYRHIRMDKNEPFYIGIGSDCEGNYTRANSAHRRNNHWKSIVKNTNYCIDIMLDELTWNFACEKEVEFIKMYGRRNIGTGVLVNLTDGGEGLVGLVHKKHTKEAKRKISEAGKGNKHSLGRKLSEEHKKKLSRIHKGRVMPEEHRLRLIELNKTRQWTDEAKDKIRKLKIGRVNSDSTRLKISQAKMGKTHSQETKNKISLALKGKVLSHERKEKRMATYVFINSKGEKVTFKGLNDFCKKNGLAASNMCKVNLGERKQHKGWRLP